MMVGGYALGSLIQTWGWPLFPSIIVGLLMAVVLALVLGVPTLRLRADYLAIATIAAAEAIRQVLGSAALNDQFGGQDGRYGFVDGMRSLNFVPSGRCALPGPGLPVVRLLHHDRRLDPRAPAVRVRLPAHAQPLGTRPQEHP